MLQVTDTAAQVMRMLLEANNVGEGNCLRLAMKEEGQFGFDIVPSDSDEAEDQTFEHEGQTILIVGKEVGAHLAGMTLDAHRNEEGQIQLALIEKGE